MRLYNTDKDDSNDLTALRKFVKQLAGKYKNRIFIKAGIQSIFPIESCVSAQHEQLKILISSNRKGRLVSTGGPVFYCVRENSNY